MLQVFHGFKKSFLLILMVVIVAFVMTGFGINLGGPKRDSFAVKIGDQEISFDQFYQERKELEARYRQVFGANFDNFAGSLKLNQQILDRLIADTLVNDFANASGLVASKVGVQKMILGSGLFQNGYDEKIYRAYLQQVGMTSAQFEAQLNSAALTEQFSNLIQDLTFASKRETESFLAQAETAYTVDYVVFDSAEYLDEVADPKDDQLKEFYESNSTDYETEPAIAYHYIVFDPKDHLGDVEVLSEDVEFYYSEHQNEFRLPEEVQARHIQLNFGKSDGPEKMSALKEKAEEIRNKALTGGSFEELVQIHSEDYATKTLGGDLGSIQRGNTVLAKEVVAAAFNLKNGGISEVIGTDYGYEIIKVDSYKEPEVKDLAKVKDEIEKKLRAEQAPAYASATAHDLYDAWLKSDLPLDQFALSKTIVSRVTSELLEVDKDPENLKGLTAKLISSADIKEQMIELGDLTILVGIKEYQPAEVPALENIKPQVVKVWKDLESKNLSQNAAQALVTAVKDGGYKTLADGAKTLKLKLEELKEITRAKAAAPFNDPSMQADLFNTTTPGKAPKRAYSLGGKHYVFQVKDLKGADSKEISKKVAEARSQESDRLGRLLLASLVKDLKAKAEIDISPSLDLDA